MVTFDVTREEYQELKLLYLDSSDKSPQHIIKWKGHEFIRGYVKYLLEYLEERFREKHT